MAVNIFDKYGIKEVANVYFEALDDDLKAGVYKGDIVLFLDTLKVSTIEQTAENVAAQGGWGNPRLVQWDYGKEINITLEDALISLESLRFMLGGAIKQATSNEKLWIRHTEEVVAQAGSNNTVVVPAPKDHLSGVKMYPAAATGHPIRLINLGGGDDSETAGTRTQITSGEMGDYSVLTFNNPKAGVTSKQPAVGDHIRIFWEEEVDGSGNEQAVEVTISPSTFPGTYRVVGDTFMRSEKTGKDEAFQFIINKAKVSSNVTITLEAEGDPSTFEMQLTVLRSAGDDGDEMMKLVRYTMSESAEASAEDDIGSLASGDAGSAG